MISKRRRKKVRNGIHCRQFSRKVNIDCCENDFAEKKYRKIEFIKN